MTHMPTALQKDVMGVGLGFLGVSDPLSGYAEGGETPQVVLDFVVE